MGLKVQLLFTQSRCTPHFFLSSSFPLSLKGVSSSDRGRKIREEGKGEPRNDRNSRGMCVGGKLEVIKAKN